MGKKETAGLRGLCRADPPGVGVLLLLRGRRRGLIATLALLVATTMMPGWRRALLVALLAFHGRAAGVAALTALRRRTLDLTALTILALLIATAMASGRR